MDYQDWEHISDTLETASNALMLALAVVCTAIALPIAIAGSPLYGIYYLLVGRPKEKKAEEERRRKEARKRRKPHATPARTGRFLFYGAQNEAYKGGRRGNVGEGFGCQRVTEIERDGREKTKRLHGFNFGLHGGADEARRMSGRFTSGLRLV